MSNLILSEWFKLARERSFWVLLIVTGAMAIVYPSLAAYGDDSSLVTVSEYYMNNVLEINAYVIKIVPCVLAGFYISREFSNGTMKTIVASGHGRTRLYVSKLLLYVGGTIALALVLPILQTGVSSALFGFRGMLDPVYYLQTIGLSVVYAAAFATMIAVLAIILTDSGKLIAVSLQFFVLFDKLLLLAANQVLVLQLVYDYSIFRYLQEIAHFDELTRRELMLMLTIPALTLISFTLLGIFLFQRKEIK